MDTPLKCPKCGQPLGAQTVAGLCPQCLLMAGLGSGSQPARPAFTPPPVADLQPHFPQLEILELIGLGGMGAVYKARQPALDRLVALKILPLQNARDPGFAERFSREARALARLNHPHIVAVYDYGQAGDFLYFVMEFVDGANLRQIERAGKLAPREALLIIPQICDALQYAHDAGVVHRDIKPENVLMDKQGRVKIADFGLAKILGYDRPEGAITAAYHALGTPHYMAPEQVERPLVVDHRADIYSLGVVFYEMLTGELPLGRFAAPSRKVPLDARLDDVVLRTLEKEPAARYQQASEVKTDVETIAGAPKASSVPAALPKALLNWRGALRGTFVTWALVMLALAAVTCGYLYLSTPQYTATATVEVMRERDEDGNPRIISDNFPTNVAAMKSTAIVTEVSEWLRRNENDRRELQRPFESSVAGATPTVEEILARGRSVKPVRMALLIQVSFTHPSPEMAQKVANLFAEEFIASEQRQRAENLEKFIQDLEYRSREMRSEVEKKQTRMNALREQYGMADGMLLERELQAAGARATATKQALDEHELAWTMVENRAREGKPLWEITQIRQQPQVAAALAEFVKAQGELAAHDGVLGENHPEMMVLRQRRASSERQLVEAVESAKETLRSDLDAARAIHQSAVARLDEIRQRAQVQAGAQIELDSVLRDLKNAEAVYMQLISVIEDKKNAFLRTMATFRIVDRAPLPLAPSNRPTPFLVFAGAIVGAIASVPLALFVGFVCLFRRRKV